MAICAISPLLAWLDSSNGDIENGSIIDLLGQISCAILVQTMTYLLLNRMYNDINNNNLQSNEIGTNQQLLEEEGRSE